MERLEGSSRIARSRGRKRTTSQPRLRCIPGHLRNCDGSCVILATDRPKRKWASCSPCACLRCPITSELLIQALSWLLVPEGRERANCFGPSSNRMKKCGRLWRATRGLRPTERHPLSVQDGCPPIRWAFELTWSNAAILGMVVKRIANTSPELAEYCSGAKIGLDRQGPLGLMPRVERPEDAFPLLERMIGEHMGATRKKGYVRNWVFTHLYDGNKHISPRTMVRLFESAATKDAANQAIPEPRLLHPTALRQGLADVATDHVAQGHHEWPWLEGVKRRLAKRPLVPWPRTHFNERLSKDWNGDWHASKPAVRPPTDRPADLGDYLIELGIVRKRTDESN